MNSPQLTLPQQVSQAALEDITWGIDMTQQLTGSQTVTQPYCLLRNLATGASVTLQDGPGVSGNVITQRIRAGALTAGSTYQLLVTYTPSGTTNVLLCLLEVGCPPI